MSVKPVIIIIIIIIIIRIQGWFCRNMEGFMR